MGAAAPALSSDLFAPRVRPNGHCQPKIGLWNPWVICHFEKKHLPPSALSGVPEHGTPARSDSH
ncbi:hypothetical protein PHLCEN_2v7319 [Hermanssonia centrifuga]|uniref:Uncharacterized protein n=1 Tax=Hermanssonia centrifuga TaxID=98765 RepID=A0A2R6NWS6_9APHY|nr:hypothetical protein PHLCEN_2v7319 [Hermanssonia centrifuga]